MNDSRKSDDCVVPEKRPNKVCGAPQTAEGVEGRRSTKGNPDRQNGDRTQSRVTLEIALERIRQAARRDKRQRFTALWHHVYDKERLREAYARLNRQGAAGVDEETWESYGKKLEERLEDLSGRLKRGAYKPRPVRRTYIAKPDGGKRPLGVPTLEDKLVQTATSEVLNAVYEQDFLGFSYGFRRGVGTHDALDALSVALEKRKVNWVLDADIRGFFDAIDHEWLIRFLEHRIGDQRVIRHVRKWLKAGVLEDGEVTWSETGTPQGGSISPLLANVYLHYVFDLWTHAWRKHAQGDVIVVRYADDFVVGFQERQEAERFMDDLRERFAKFGLELHSDKTRLIRFGRFAARERKRRGERKPETFDFLGFTHICGTTRKGWFQVRRITIKKRLRRKLKELKLQLRRMMHLPIETVGRWLGRVLRGYYRFHAIPGNMRTLWTFRWNLGWIWKRVLERRSQKARLTWDTMSLIIDQWLPKPHVMHAYPQQRLRVNTRGRSPVR
jgi:group II intron reverse transcriptase/maturase